MPTAGFWADGPGKHRRAVEKQIAKLKKRLTECKPDEREQTAKELEQLAGELKKSSDRRILW